MVNGKECYMFLLKKSLYKLKQSPHKWYKRFDTFMVNNSCSKNYEIDLIVLDTCLVNER